MNGILKILDRKAKDKAKKTLKDPNNKGIDSMLYKRAQELERIRKELRY
jgi:hypothetical protein